jgi:hypothetical protein
MDLKQSRVKFLVRTSRARRIELEKSISKNLSAKFLACLLLPFCKISREKK